MSGVRGEGASSDATARAGAPKPSRAGPGPALRFRGPIAALGTGDRVALFERSTSADPDLRAGVAAILDRVRREGDAALLAMAREYDGVTPASIEVPAERCRAALETLDPRLRAAFERTARNLETVHRASRPRASEVETEPGVVVGRRPDPLDRVGLYAPGGRASYPSSVLMGAIPARIAGVREIVLCSPPRGDGLPAAPVLAAAALAGVDRVFAAGGAGAIAAMGFGTASVPRVDRIVGPGNAWVAEAKLQVAGHVSIDSPAGPSEALILADDTAEPSLVAREMIAQAEHDPDACAVAVALGEALAAAIVDALAQALPGAGRGEIAARALAARGGVLSAADLDQALAFAADYAAEHVLLALAEPRAALARLRHAGTVFLGGTSSIAFGDYMTGGNHVLPTGGLARSYSGLSTLDFVRWTTWQEVGRGAAARLADDVGRFADAEDLPGHAAAARAWTDAADAATAAPAPHPLARAANRDLPVYATGAPAAELDLSDNTRLDGPPPAAVAALREIPAADLARYPEPYSDTLRAALARYAGVTPECVAVGCGSDNLLDVAFRAFGEAGDRVAHADPTFSMVPVFARANGLDPVGLPFDRDFDLDPAALLATRPRIVYLCSPNNPTGTALPRATIRCVTERALGLVILDEAYAEYAGVSWAGEAPARGNLLVLRTLSKAFGLAGLRIGWAVADPAIVREIEKTRGPYAVSVAAERAALAALERDREAVLASAREVAVTRDRLVAALRGRGFAPPPSAANFVLVPVRDAALATAALGRAGIAVRPFRGLRGIGDALRVTVGPWAAMERVLAALGEAR